MLTDFNRLTTPTSAFITFEEELGVMMALKSKRNKQEGPFILPGQCFGYFKQAPEPTDIIWENRHYTTFDLYKRAFISYGIIVIILLLSFYFLFFLAAKEIWVTRVFGPVNCSQIENTYGD